MSNFTFGTVTAPDGKRGPWTIDTFEIKDDHQMMMFNLRVVRAGNPDLVVKPGVYRRLSHEDRGVIMSNTPMEVLTARPAYDYATGHVLVNGLGLGMVIEGLLSKSDVKSITVVELDPKVIALVGPTVKRDKRVKVVRADAEAFEPPSFMFYDYVWHDVWDTIDDDNLPQMDRLMAKYRKISMLQGCWSRPQALRLRAQMRALQLP